MSATLIDENFAPLAAALVNDGDASLRAILKWLPIALQLHDFDRGNYYLRILLSLLDAKHEFSDSDRISLIHQTSAWLFERGVEIFIQLRSLQVLQELLSKSDLKDLTLDWHSWFNQLQSMHFAGNRGLNHSEPILGQHLKAWKKTVIKARKYFSPNAQLEIYNKFFEFIQPFDSMANKSIMLISLLSPTRQIEHGQNYDLIIPSLHSTFIWFNQSRAEILPFYIFYARLSRHQLGKVSLMEYLPQLYNTYLQLLQLPIGKESAINHGDGGNSAYNELSGSAIDGISKSLAQITIAHLHCKPKPQTNERPALALLSQFMHVVSTYYHPSNQGKWSAPLAAFLGELGVQYAKRKGFESRKEAKYSEDLYLDPNDNSLVSVLLPTVLRALFAKSTSMVSAAEQWLRQVAFFHPSLILPALLEHVYPALDDLSSPHRMLSVMQSMSNLATIIFHRKFWPQGAQHLDALLWACLPGIDPIDPMKTSLTLTWFTVAFMHIPLIDARQSDGLSKSRIDRGDEAVKPVHEKISSKYKLASDAGGVEHEDDYNESDPMSVDDDVDAEDDARSVTFRFEDWSLSFLDSLFKLLSSVDKFQKKDVLDVHSLQLLNSVSRAFFNAMSEQIYKSCINKLAKHLLSSHQPHAQKQLGILVANAATIHPDILLPALFDPLYKRIVNNEKLSSTLATSELNWAIYLLSRCVKHAAGGGPTRHSLLKYREKVLTVYRLTQSHSDRAVRKVSAKLLRNFLSSLSSVYPAEWRPFDSRQWNDQTEKWKHYNCWSAYEPIEERDQVISDPMTVWHVPSAEELQTVQEIVNSELETPIKVIRDFTAGIQQPAVNNEEISATTELDDKVGKGDGPIERALLQVVSIVRGSQNVLGDLSSDNDQDQRNVDGVDKADDEDVGMADKNELDNFSGSRCPANRIKQSRPIQPIQGTIDSLSGSHSLRSSLLSITHLLSSKLLSSLANSSLKCLTVTMKLLKYLLTMYGVDEKKLQTEQFIGALTRTWLREYRTGFKVTARPLLIHRSYEFYQWRIINSSRTQSYTQHVRDIASNVHKLAVNDFAKVQKKAQKLLRDFCFHFPQSIESTITAMVQVLKNESSSAESVQGALQTLAEPVYLALTTRRWSRLAPVIESLVDLKLKGNDRVEIIVQTYFSAIYPILFALQTEIPVINSNDNPNQLSQNQITRRNETIARYNEENSGTYRSMMSLLLNRAKDSSLHWRYQLMAVAFMFAMLRPAALDTELYTAIVKFFTEALHSEFAPLRRIAVETMLHIFGMHVEAINDQAKIAVGPVSQTIFNTPNSVTSPSASVTNNGNFSSLAVIESEAEWLNTNFYDYLYSGWRDENSSLATQYKLIPNDSNRYATFKSSPFSSWHGGHIQPKRVALSNSCIAFIRQSVVEHFSVIVDSLVYDHPSLAAGVGEGGQPQAKVTGAGETIAHLCVSHLGAPSWPYTGLGSKSGAFDSNHLTFIRGLVETIPDLLNENIFDRELRRLIEHESEPDYQCTAAEIVAGIIIGSKHLSFARQQSVKNLLIPVITIALNNSVPDSITHWTASLRHSFTNTDPRRLSWLTSLLIQSALHTSPAATLTAGTSSGLHKSPSSDVSSPLQTFKRFRFLVSVFIEHGYRASELGGWVLDRVVADGWIHSPYKQIRNEIELLVYAITGGMFKLNTKASEKGKLEIEPNPHQLKFLTKLVEGLEAANTEEANYNNNNNAMSDGETQQSTSDDAASQSKNLVDTSVGIFVKLVSLGQIEQRSALYQTLLPFIIKAQQSNDQECAATAKVATRGAAWTTLQGTLTRVESGIVSQSSLIDSEAYIGGVLESVSSLANLSTNWHVRVSALKFLSAVVPRHSLLITANQVENVEKIILARLVDNQVEVRESAAVALTALISSCLAHPSLVAAGFSSSQHVSEHVKKLQKTFTKYSTTSLSKTNGLAKRHGGVIGLLAIISCHPYDLPPHLPPLLAELSSHVNEPAPISSAVKKTFGDFIRTHQDEWEEFKLKFSEQELEALQSVQSAPTYFA